MISRQSINKMIPKSSLPTSMVQEVQHSHHDLTNVQYDPLCTPKNHNPFVNDSAPSIRNRHIYTTLGTSYAKCSTPEGLTLSPHQVSTMPNPPLTKMMLLKPKNINRSTN